MYTNELLKTVNGELFFILMPYFIFTCKDQENYMQIEMKTNKWKYTQNTEHPTQWAK